MNMKVDGSPRDLFANDALRFERTSAAGTGSKTQVAQAAERLNAESSNAEITPGNLFNSASNAQESELALAALVGSESYARELGSKLGRIQLLGPFNTDIRALLSGNYAQFATGAFGVDIPIKNNRDALKAEAVIRQRFSATGFDVANQKVRFLTSGLLLDASTRKTIINDLQEIAKAQKQLVQVLEHWQKQPGSRIDDQQVIDAQRDLQRTEVALSKQQRDLNLAFDQLKTLTGNRSLNLEQVPVLKNSQLTSPAPAVTESEYLLKNRSKVIQEALNNNSDIKAVSAALELAKARYKVVEGSAVSTSLRAPNLLGTIFGLFTNPLGTILNVASNAFRGEKRDVTTQLAEARGIIAQREAELNVYKEQVRKSLEIQLDTINSSDLRNQVETQKNAVNIAHEKYLSLSRWAGMQGSTVGSEELLRAKVAFLEQRQAYNELAQQFMVAMNRVVSTSGGYGNPNSDLFKAFDGNFNLYWGKN